MEENIVDACGCEHTFVAGKWLHIYCDDHDPDSILELEKQPIRKVSKHQLIYD